MRYLVVLGDQLREGGSMSHALVSRLQVCISLYTPGDHIILCGGNVCGLKDRIQGKEPSCRHSEAYVMKKYMLKHIPNIPRGHLILENTSLDTIQNIQHVHNILISRSHSRSHSTSYTRKHSPVICITSYWHMPRVKAICRVFLSRPVHFCASYDRVPPDRVRQEKKYLRRFTQRLRHV